MAAWTTDESGALDPCGHCDNCTRLPETVERKDVTLATWQLLKIIQAVRKEGTKLTLSQLVTLARGGKKGAYEVKHGRKKQQSTLDLDLVAGGPVELSKNVSGPSDMSVSLLSDIVLIVFRNSSI
jgi:ATP-dependent DNA helicase Q1